MSNMNICLCKVMEFINGLSILEMKARNVLLIDSATTHSILQYKKYILEIKLLEEKNKYYI